MAKKSMIAKATREPRYAVRKYHRCNICGRSRAYMNKFGVCRICFRTLALNAQLPGVRKSSW